VYRESFRPFWRMVTALQDARQQRLLVRGAPGSGKSVLLAATVERLRKAGWCAPGISAVRESAAF
jgi:nucleoside-triphosphatase THEP1